MARGKRKPPNDVTSDTEGTEEEDTNTQTKKRPARSRKQSTKYGSVEYVTPTKAKGSKNGYVFTLILL